MSKCRRIQWLFSRIRPVLRLQLGSLGCTVTGSVLGVADPLIMKWLIDVVIPQKQLALLLGGVLGFAALYLARLVLTFCGVLLNFTALQKVTFRIRVALVRALHCRSAKQYESHPSGELLYRIEQDVTHIGDLGGDILPNVTRMLIVAVIVVATMCLLNLRLTALVLPLLPCFYFVQRKHHLRLLQAAEATQQQSGRTTSVLQEHLTGMLQLMLLNRQGSHARSYARSAAEGSRRQTKQRIAEIRFSGSYLSLIVIGSTAILGYGGYEVTKGELSIGGLVAFYSYVTRLFEPLMIAVDLQSRIQRVTASLQRIVEIESFKTDRHHMARGPRIHAQTLPEVEFRLVHFSHGRDREVLRGVTFRIEAGEKAVIVGGSGSGKSTLAGLAVGLYVPNSGNVLIGSADICRIDRRNLRSIVSLVPQDSVLFNGTLRENLLYGNPGATAREIEDALSHAQLHTLVSRLPGGLDGDLGCMGNKLSGGEKKRVALARAMLQRSRVLILDELLGALDNPTTEATLRGIDEFQQDRTVIVISHKPITITWADKIIVMHDGRVLDTGPHAELVQRCAAYDNLIRNELFISAGTRPRGHISEKEGPMGNDVM